jgi:hypothetical protein
LLTSSSLKPVLSDSLFSGGGSECSIDRSLVSELPNKLRPGDGPGVVERALLDRGVQKTSSCNEVGGEEVDRLLK